MPARSAGPSIATKMALIALAVIFLTAIGAGAAEKVCIVGSGIGGASAAFFLRNYSTKPIEIEIYEKHGQVGGRLAQVQLKDDKFEAGGSIIASKNHYMRSFTELLGLTPTSDFGDDSFGIWDGRQIFFRTLAPGDSYVSQKFTSIWNSWLLFWRYGMSLLKMQALVSDMLERWEQLYKEGIPVYKTVEDLLKSINLYSPTQRTFEQDLVATGCSSRLINELITVIMRINYGQNVSVHGLVGAVALAGSGDNLWKVKEGNWKVAEGLIKYSQCSLHLKEEVQSLNYTEGVYSMVLDSNKTTKCDAVIIATPLDEEDISFSPSIEIPNRSLQHTYVTFVHGLINSEYFGAASAADLPALIGTIEDSNLQFTSISVLKSYSELEMVYKVFSRAPLTDADLDRFFRTRIQTLRFNWGAYPQYTVPEQLGQFVLDDKHLYYINSFESAVSAMEASAVAAKNVARLLLSRMSGGILARSVDKLDYESTEDL